MPTQLLCRPAPDPGSIGCDVFPPRYTTRTETSLYRMLSTAGAMESTMTLVKPVMMNCAPIAATNSRKMRIPILSPTLPKSRCSPLPDARMTQHSRAVHTPFAHRRCSQ